MEGGAPLQFGSKIILSNQQGFLSSQGFTDNSLVIQNRENDSDIMGSVFRIVPQALLPVQEEALHMLKDTNDCKKLWPALEKEIKGNIQSYNNLKGQYVHFGSLIQLEHVWTNKFLSIHYTESAHKEKHNIRLALEDFGGKHSHLRVAHCYKFQQEGDGLVRIGDKVVLEGNIPGLLRPAFVHCSKTGEVNASLENKSTRWTLNLYLGVNDESYLSCGDYIWLFDSELDLCIAVNQGIELSKSMYDTNGLWKIEGDPPTRGGFVTPDKVYKLRHLSSTLYLSEENGKLCLQPKEAEGTLWHLQTLPERTEKVLYRDDFCKIVNAKSKLVLLTEKGKMFLSEEGNYPFLKVLKSDDSFVWESLFLFFCKPVLNKFPNVIASKENLINECENVSRCVSNIQLFVEDKLSIPSSIGSRRKLIREHKIIDLLVMILEAYTCSNLPLGIREMKSRRESFLMTAEEMRNAAGMDLGMLCSSIYKLIGNICKGDTENQEYTSSFFTIMQEHAGLKIGASNCMKGIMSSNKSVLQKISEDTLKHYIQLLSGNPVVRKPQLLSFLQEACRFQEEGLSVNQEKIHREFFREEIFKKVMIETSVEYESLYISIDTPGRVTSMPFEDCFNYSVLARHTKEVEYFLGLLELFSALCMSRNYLTKYTIRDKFPLSILIDYMTKSSLSVSARAAFCKLLLHMHIDSYPRESFKKPELVRVLGIQTPKDLKSVVKHIYSVLEDEIDISLLQKSSHIYFNSNRKRTEPRRGMGQRVKHLMGGGNRVLPEEVKGLVMRDFTLFHLKCILFNYCEEYYEKPMDELFYWILKMINKMAQQDIFGPYCSDMYNYSMVVNPRSNGFESSKIDLVVLLKIIVPMLYENLGPLSFDEDSDRQLEALELPVSESDENPMLVNAVKLKNHILKTRNFKQVIECEFETKCKLEIIQYTKYYMDCRMDAFLRNAIDWFNKQQSDDFSGLETIIPPLLNSHSQNSHSNSHSQSHFKWIKKPKFPDLNCVTDKITIELVRLFCTSGFEMQTGVLSVLLRSYSQRQEFFKNIKKLHPIMTPHDNDLFTWTKINLNILRQHVEQSEVWLRYFMQTGSMLKQSKNQFEIVFNILKRLNCILYRFSTLRNGVPHLENDSRISKERQVLLAHLGVHRVVTKLIEDGMRVLNSLDRAYTEPFDTILNLFKLCFQILTNFAINNPKNQKALFKDINVFTQFLNIDAGQIPFLMTLFKDNYELCCKVTVNFLKVFTDLIVNEGRQPQFLDIFEVIQISKKTPIPHVQHNVLQAFLSPEHSMHVLYMVREGEFTFEVAHSNDRPYEYHARLINILSICGEGQAGAYLNEAKCQKILPLINLMDLLTKAERGELQCLRIPLLNFLYHNYQDTERTLENMSYSSEFIDYVKMQTAALDCMSEPPEDFHGFFNAWIRILHTYYKRYLLTGSHYDGLEDFLVLQNYIQSVTFKSKLIFSAVSFNEALFTQLQELVTVMDVPNILDLFGECEVIHTNSDEEEDEAESPGISASWQRLVDSLVYNKENIHWIEEEKLALRLAVFSVDDQTLNTFLREMVNFINIGIMQAVSYKQIVEALDFLGGLVSDADAQTDKKGLRTLLRNFGISKAILSLLCDKSLGQRIFYSLLRFSVKLLDGGDLELQSEFYQHFISEQSSRVFFKRVHSELSNLREIKESPIFLEKPRPRQDSLRMIQLLCENHNSNLQNYMREQHKSRRSYDLVQATVLLLGSLLSNKLKSRFNELSQCFDTLTDLVQGPCMENQKSIIDGRFLEFSADLLSIDEYSQFAERYPRLTDREPREINGEDLLEGWMIAELKLKCLITMHSLLEGRTDKYVLSRMVRLHSPDIMKDNILSIFKSYEAKYGPKYYQNDVFYQANREDPVIIEVGFLLYYLLKMFMESDIPENQMYLAEEEPRNKSEIKSLGKSIGVRKRAVPESLLQTAFDFFEEHTGSVEVLVFNSQIYKLYFWLPPEAKHLTRDIKNNFHNKADRTSDKTKLQYLVRKRKKIAEEMFHEAWLQKTFNKHKVLSFFATNVKLWRDIGFLMTVVINFIVVTSYPDQEETNNSDPILFWAIFEDGLLSKSHTNILLLCFGGIQVFCALLITLFFILSKGLVIAKRKWRKRMKRKNQVKKAGKFVGAIRMCKMIVLNGFNVLRSIHILYHLMYMSFAILGLIVHHFFFSFHLTEIIYRSESLQNVIRSISKTQESLILTFLWMLIIIYMFTLWGYTAFKDDFMGERTPENHCTTLLMCLSVVFDQGFKNDGGIGGYMTNQVSGFHYFYRILFDNAYNIIVMIIMLNIVQGIIINTFALLRQEQEQNKLDRESKCFICGIDSDTIERATSSSFKHHIENEHNEWNYVLFMLYLDKKKQTEFTGIESQVFSKINNDGISWFPLGRALSIRETESQEQFALAESLKRINEQIENMRNEIKMRKT